MGNAGRQRLQAALRGQRLPETHDSSVGKQALPGVAARARARTRPIPKSSPRGFGHEKGGHEEGGHEEGGVAGPGLMRGGAGWGRSAYGTRRRGGDERGVGWRQA